MTLTDIGITRNQSSNGTNLQGCPRLLAVIVLVLVDRNN